MIKQKNLFKLIAVAISVVVVAIACNNKPTAVNSFSLDPVDPTNVAPITPPKPDENPNVPEKTYKITIFYPEVISALKDKNIDLDAVKASDQETLNRIWKTMVNDGSKRITGLSGQKVKNYNDLNEKSIYFDTNGDLKHRGTTIDSKDRGAILKTFEKALIVDYTYKNEKIYVVAAIYNAKTFSGQNQQLLRGFSPANGGPELLFIAHNRQSNWSFDGGVIGYDMLIKYGASSVNDDFSKYTRVWSSINNYSEVDGLRFYRIDATK